MVWWPTRLGWCCFVFLPVFLLGCWVLLGESLLAKTKRVPADTLVVEGWIGRESFPEAMQEFKDGGYDRLIVTGGLTGYPWAKDRVNVTQMAEREFHRLGFPEGKLFLAPCEDVDKQRTYVSALATKRMMETNGLTTKGINVMSRGAHAKRTHLVFKKVFNTERVGIISWNPLGSKDENWWWQSSNRSKDMLDETFGYSYELLFSSGRPDGIRRFRIATGAAVILFILVLARHLRSAKNRETWSATND